MLLLLFTAALSVPDKGFYVIGGEDRQAAGTTLDSVDFIASTGGTAWTAVAPLPKTLKNHAGAHFPPTPSGVLYVMGGVHEDGKPQSGVYVMDTTAWATAPPLSGPRHGHTAIAAPEHLYVVGGASNTVPPISVLDTVERLSLTTGTWDTGGVGWGSLGQKRLYLGGAFA
eukprot:Hpha_TRINITY_DN35767_c0_g1::TRINITY_DN35767_c0_g1_i1::g.139868::m.139868